MSDRRFRLLHRAIGSKELFSYWYASELLQFRRLFGLRHRPGSTSEADAFFWWLKHQHGHQGPWQQRT